MAESIYRAIDVAFGPTGYLYRPQGGFLPNETLPDVFLTYYVINKSDIAHANNKAYASTARVQMAIYATDPAITQNGDEILKNILVPAGFTRLNGRDLPYSIETGHYGYTCDYQYYIEED